MFICRRSLQDANYFCDLDDGEAESLAYLTRQAKLDFRFSSGDAIAYKVLGNLNLAEQGIALAASPLIPQHHC